MIAQRVLQSAEIVGVEGQRVHVGVVVVQVVRLHEGNAQQEEGAEEADEQVGQRDGRHEGPQHRVVVDVVEGRPNNRQRLLPEGEA